MLKWTLAEWPLSSTAHYVISTRFWHNLCAKETEMDRKRGKGECHHRGGDQHNKLKLYLPFSFLVKVTDNSSDVQPYSGFVT